MEEAIARGGGIASLGFGLSDVQPDVVESALPHGVGGWSGSRGQGGGTFQCLDSPGELGQEVSSPDDDEYADDEEHTATTDVEIKRYIVRYGTYWKLRGHARTSTTPRGLKIPRTRRHQVDVRNVPNEPDDFLWIQRVRVRRSVPEHPLG